MVRAPLLLPLFPRKPAETKFNPLISLSPKYELDNPRSKYYPFIKVEIESTHIPELLGA